MQPKRKNARSEPAIVAPDFKAVGDRQIAAAASLCFTFLILATIMAWVSYQMSASSSNVPWLVPFVAVFGLATIEFFAWSWLFSLILSRPLNAAVVGIFFASAGIQVAVFFTKDGNIDYASLEPYIVAWPVRLAIATMVLIACAVLAKDWLNTDYKSRRSITSEGSRSIASVISAPGRMTSRLIRKNTGPYSRLTWQSLRQSWKSVVLAYVGTVLFGLLMAVAGPNLIVWGVSLMIIAGGFVGLVAFSADQRRDGQQFLAAHGVSPTLIWFARTLPWIILLAMFLLVTYLAFIIGFAVAGELQTAPQTLLFGGGNSIDSGPMMNQILGRSAMFSLGIGVTIFGVGTLLCFSAGQFVSLAIRSRILAAVATMFVFAPLVAWLYLMWLGGVPIWWSVLPVVAAFLCAGWMSMRAVLSEKSIVSRVVVPSVLILVTVVIVFFEQHDFAQHKSQRWPLNLNESTILTRQSSRRSIKNSIRRLRW